MSAESSQSPLSSPPPLTSKLALVTGGGRGIGAAIARHLATLGCRVVVTGRTRAEIAGIADEIGGLAIACDLGDRASIDALLDTLKSEVGTVDILVNNAGIADSAPLRSMTDAHWDLIMEVNVTAPMRLCRALIPPMIAKQWGRVVNIASNAGVSGYAYTSAYCASKHALVGLTRALAVELAQTGVTINALCPGWVDTRMIDNAVERISSTTRRSHEEARAALAKMSPQGRILAPQEVAHMVAVLCDDLSRGIHGQAIVIDGGQVLK